MRRVVIQYQGGEAMAEEMRTHTLDDMLTWEHMSVTVKGAHYLATWEETRLRVS